MCCWFESNQACFIKNLDMFGKIKKFISEAIVELKKVTWSTRKEVQDATYVVIVSSLMLGSFIASCDFILSKALGLIIR